ncbi:MAG: carboxypeptidase-like regulatory domain-containing protein [Verrucomicrobiota bacterium]
MVGSNEILELNDGVLELLGLIVNGKELDSGIVARLDRSGNRWLPIEALTDALMVNGLKMLEGRLVFKTPLGLAEISYSDIRRFDNELFVEQNVFADATAGQASFDAESYSLELRFTWTPKLEEDSEEAGDIRENPIRPEIVAPLFDLSRFRGEIRTTEESGRGTQTNGFAQFYGRAGPGTFQGRFRSNSEGEYTLDNYQWRTRGGNFAGLVGNEVVGVHSLLDSTDFTGAQGAWSNLPDKLLVDAGSDRRGLVESRVSPVRNLRGQGPAGGIAELRIDGVVVASQRIPLDGEFEFLGVDTPLGVSQVEVALSRPFNLATPSEIIDFSDRASAELLPAGGAVVTGGLGVNGNPLSEISSEEDYAAAGFIHGRYGLSERFTLEAGLQSFDGEEESFFGFVSNLGPYALISAAYGQSGSESAYQFSLEGEKGPFRWRGSFLEQEAFFNDDSDRVRDARGEFSWQYSRALELGLIGRERFGEGTDANYVLPWIEIRPNSSILWRSRPDSFGEYVHDFRWRFNRMTRLNAQGDDDSVRASLNHRWSSSWSSSLSAVREFEVNSSLYTLANTFREMDPYGWRVDFGLSSTSVDVGAFLQVEREVLPGLRLRGELRQDPSGEQSEGGRFLGLTASFDFSRAGQGFTRSRAVRPNSGSIGGRIIGAGRSMPNLEGVGISVNGRTLAEADENGRFSVPDLEADVYEISLDESRLPIELNNQGPPKWVEVVDGASTSVNLEVTLLLGVAGSILGYTPSDMERDLSVIILDQGGKFVASSRLTRFGYWRIDGLPPGEYTATLVESEGRKIQEQAIKLVDKFLFRQDFTLKEI